MNDRQAQRRTWVAVPSSRDLDKVPAFHRLLSIAIHRDAHLTHSADLLKRLLGGKSIGDKVAARELDAGAKARASPGADRDEDVAEERKSVGRGVM